MEVINRSSNILSLLPPFLRTFPGLLKSFAIRYFAFVTWEWKIRAAKKLGIVPKLCPIG
jgi:hypothetical protein